MPTTETKREPRREFLTDSKMKALKPLPGYERDVVWDTGMPGMAVRLTTKRGKKTFCAVRRRAGDFAPTWATLGNYPVLTLAKAREKAREALLALERGEHPKALAAAERRKTREAERATFAAVTEAFARQQFSDLSPSTRRTYERQRVTVSKTLGDRPIASLRRSEIIEVIEEIRDTSGQPSAKVALGVVRRVLNWALGRDIEGFDANPAAGISEKDLIGKLKPRERVLSDSEAAAVWRATAAIGEPWATIYRLLMLLGLRRDEVGSARWSELNLEAGTFDIPGSRTKNGDAMLVPLPPRAIALFAAMPRYNGGDFVFSTTAGRSPVAAYSHAKAKLDAAVAAQGDSVPPWRVHDLRRVVRSGLSKLKVDHVTKELVLGHRQRGISAVYDKHDYLDEKREALQRWERHLLGLVEPAPDAGDKVVAIKRGARG